MAALVTQTFSDLQALTRTLLEDTGTTLFSDDEVKRAINNAYAYLYNEGVRLSDGQGIACTKLDIDVTADTDTISMPSDFYRCVSIAYKEGETSYIQWKPISGPIEIARWASTITRDSKLKGYYFRGNSTLVMVPSPSWTGTAEMHYIPNPVMLDVSSDEPLFPKSHRELIAYEAFFRLIQKEGIDPGASSAGIRRDLKVAFENDMEDMQKQENRELVGDGMYWIYG